MISVSIVTYSSSIDDVEKCLNSFIASALIKEVIICENTEVPVLSSSALGKISPKISYISNPLNTGYGSGHNLAYSKVQSKGDYHVVMNLDVQAESLVFQSLFDFMEASQDVLQVMPKVLNTDGTTQRLCKMLPNPMNLIGRRFIRNRGLAANIDREYTLHDYSFEKILDCPYLSGCFMFLRRNAFESVSGFDERFFMYPEDIDLTRRLHEKGRTVCYPFVSIVHEHGQASYKSTKMLLIHIKGIVKYFNKWGWFFDSKRRVYNKRLKLSLRS
jgi:GT2 family glycosyltransferase